MEARTLAERERELQLVRVDYNTLKKHTLDRNEVLDLSMLPTETSISFCTAKLEDDHFVVDDTGHDATQMAEIRKHDVTLREAKYMICSPNDGNVVRTFTKEIGITFKLPSIHGNGRKREVVTFLDGTSAVYLSTHLNNSVPGGSGNGAYGKFGSVEQMRMDYDKHRGAYLFLGQHTIKFTNRLKGRAQVSFLGLPRGTTFNTKNGGQFEVRRRTNVDVNAVTHVASGHLLVKPLNNEAMAAATNNGWAHHAEPNGESLFVAGHNLHGDIAKYDVDVTSITCPFKSPFDTVHYGLTNDHMVGIRGVNTAVKQQAGMIFHTDQDKLVADLDDFLFGA